MARPIPLGIDDFRQLREQGLEYVDKSDLIQKVLDKGAQSILLPRPRRFGKTLNLSMLRAFFEKRPEDLGGLFSDLAIWSAGPTYREHFQRYPVIHLTFKGVKLDTFERSWDAIRNKLAALYEEHRYLLDGGALSPQEAARFEEIRGAAGSMATSSNVLLDLSRYLHRHHGQPVVILIDEYDEPIHAGHTHGYSDQVLQFFRAFLTEGLKGNPHLFKAVLTGILRIAKESIFSGLNNLAVYSLLRPDFATCFGFTEPEVQALLERASRRDQLGTVRSWYNGYVFGGAVVYNPWSILSYLDSPETAPRSFWVATSSNDLIRDALVRHSLEAEREIETLLQGGSIERDLDENVALSRIDEDPDALWSLLTFSGYLKAEALPPEPGEKILYRLSIPNKEVREVYTGTFRRWMADRMRGHGGSLKRLTTALLSGDPDALEEELQAFTRNLLSYHDTALRPEQVYHAFVIGLLASLEPEYEVRSNRESGSGRPDVLVRPRRSGKPGAVLEMKVARPGKKTPEQALEEGLAQLATGDYTAELVAAGASPVHAFAVAFDGKRVQVRCPPGPVTAS